ncbi:DNA-directed RNA polymerase subunit H [Candidatus Micrarchaeota archaeon]|nr:DNA-directed RNA polymerase subunit H [Candidatus Micrarchaeota archaeon]
MKKNDVSGVNVLAHSLNPEMKVLSESEKKKVLDHYGVSEGQLPRVLLTDPLVVTLKASVGNVIKMQRNDGTGEYVAYRIVVEK